MEQRGARCLGTEGVRVSPAVDLMGCSPPGSSVPGILHARILEWVAMPSSKRSSQTQGLNLVLLYWQEDSLPSEPPGSPWDRGRVVLF